MDFREMVVTALDAHMASGKVEATIEAAVAKAVTDVINEQFRSYGTFGEQLKAALTKSFGIGEDLDLPSYNHAVLHIVRMQVEAATTGAIQKQVAERMASLLETPPESIKLTELVAKFLEDVKEDNSGECVCHGDEAITLLIVPNDYGFLYVYLDDQANRDKDKCDIQMGFHKEKLFSLRFRDCNVEKEMFAGTDLRGFERLLFQMKAAGTKVIIDSQDPDDFETSYSSFD